MTSEVIRTSQSQNILIYQIFNIQSKSTVLRRLTHNNKRQEEITEQQLIYKLNCIRQGLNRDHSCRIIIYLNIFGFPLLISPHHCINWCIVLTCFVRVRNNCTACFGYFLLMYFSSFISVEMLITGST